MILNLLFSLILAQSFEIKIQDSAIRHGIDPKLAVSIAVVESNMNPCKIGDLGEYGLFQLRPEFHKTKLCEVDKHIEIAVKYLVYVRKRCLRRYGDAWFVCFNTDPNRQHVLKDPKRFPYYIKVMKVMNEAT